MTSVASKRYDICINSNRIVRAKRLVLSDVCYRYSSLRIKAASRSRSIPSTLHPHFILLSYHFGHHCLCLGIPYCLNYSLVMSDRKRSNDGYAFSCSLCLATGSSKSSTCSGTGPNTPTGGCYHGDQSTWTEQKLRHTVIDADQGR